MKKTLIGIVVVLVIAIASVTGYFYYIDASQYRKTLDSEVNSTQRNFEYAESQRTQVYWRGKDSFGLNIGTFSDKETAAREIARLFEVYNPASINYGKYVHYDEETGVFFYQSGEKVVIITSASPKEVVDSFIFWLVKRIPPI